MAIEANMEVVDRGEQFSMKLRCGHLVVLNTIDAILTLYAMISIPSASEANPFWSQIISISPWAFLLAKLLVGTYLISLLYRCETPSIRRFGSSLCIAIYWGILIQNSLLILAVRTDIFF